MSIELIRDLLLWNTIVNCGILVVCFLVFVFATARARPMVSSFE